jgi:hypothetical protein
MAVGGMTFQDLQNTALWRLRLQGANFGGAAANPTTAPNPPYVVKMLLNQAYAEFVERTRAAQIVTMKTAFLTTLNAIQYPIRPLPLYTDGVTPNPAVLRIWEMTYTTQTGGENAGYEYEIDLVNTVRFAQLTGDYTRRLSWFGPRVLYATRQYRKPFVDVAPGCATAGDFISVTLTPDILNAPADLTCAMGGPMVNDADVPLVPPQYQMALVDYVVALVGDAANKGQQIQQAQQRFDRYVAEALGEGSTEDGGDPQTVQDNWVQPVIRDAAMPLN